jgi:hypothetical protein
MLLSYILSNLFTMEKTQLIGKRILINYMDDPYPVPQGTEGTISGIDGIGQIQVKWDNGSTLSVIEGIDNFEILD